LKIENDPSSHSLRIHINMLRKRLIVVALACRLVQSIGNGCKYRREEWFTKTCRLFFILHKMNLDIFGRFLLTNHLILMEIVLFWNAFFKRKLSKQCISNPIYDSTFTH